MPLFSLHEKLNTAEKILERINTTEDCNKYGLTINYSEALDIKSIISILRNGEDAHTVCVNIKNFFELFKIDIVESNNRCYIIKPNLKSAHKFENEPWYADLCLLLESGYCTPAKEHLDPIANACCELSFRVSYRNYFGLDYIVSCAEYDHCSLKRYDCLAYFLEKAKSELTELSQDCTWKAPKPGVLKEWSDAAFRYERLHQMLDEIYHYHRDFENIVKVYIGTISGYESGVTKTENAYTYINHVDFAVAFTESSYSSLKDNIILNIDHKLGIEWLVNPYYDEERHRRYDEGESTLLRAYVDRINVIRRLEWVEKRYSPDRYGESEQLMK